MRVFLTCLALAGAAVPAQAQSDQEMALQRCVWGCLAQSSGNQDSAYHACVERRCAPAPGCTEMRFAPGATSAEIAAAAPADGVLCYRMRTGAGQQARVEVLEGANTIVTVVGVPDAEARQDVTFTTRATEYELRVGQLMRATEPQRFRMRVSVK